MNDANNLIKFHKNRINKKKLKRKTKKKGKDKPHLI